ncbi:MAG: hypothetical protein ACE5GM_11600, partial [bacterium]
MLFRELKDPLLQEAVSGFSLQSLHPVSGDESDRIMADLERKYQNHEIFRLFGTSGIRGIFKLITDKPVTAYQRENHISPKLAYFYGRAYGKMTLNHGMAPEVHVAMDPRGSGPAMAAALMTGLVEEGVSVKFSGVSSTPSGSFFPNSIIVTASHNPTEYNGIKAFINEIPITYETEWEVERYFRTLEILEERGCFPGKAETPGQVTDNSRDIYSLCLEHIRREAKKEGLLPDDDQGDYPLKGCCMPLDLAYGSVASRVEKESVHLSSQIKGLLETGMVLVGYGTEQNPEKINYRIGAAYPYGETPEKMTEGELAAFAAGKYGYGQDRFTQKAHYRSFYFPCLYKFHDSSLPEKGLKLDTGETLFLEADRDPRLAEALERELSRLKLLPACSVDCDGDRFLATDPELCRKPVPYLSGDSMIMLFALAMKDSLEEVVYTVESGLSIGKFLEAKHIDYQEVTVGDRAIADYLSEKGETGVSIGGEPSGHMMFRETAGNKSRIVDDPIITQLRILGIMRRANRHFGQLINEVQEEEVYTARKPEAWAGDRSGITLWEKNRLELGTIKRVGGKKYLRLNE